jgi:hypothetical protein
MWSDTGSAVFQSKGDRTKKTNLDGMNLAGPVKGSRHVEVSGLKFKSQHYSVQASEENKGASHF